MNSGVGPQVEFFELRLALLSLLELKELVLGHSLSFELGLLAVRSLRFVFPWNGFEIELLRPGDLLNLDLWLVDLLELGPVEGPRLEGGERRTILVGAFCWFGLGELELCNLRGLLPLDQGQGPLASQNGLVQFSRLEGHFLGALLRPLHLQLLPLFRPEVRRLRSRQPQVSLLWRRVPQLEVLLHLLAEGHELTALLTLVLLLVESHLF